MPRARSLVLIAAISLAACASAQSSGQGSPSPSSSSSTAPSPSFTPPPQPRPATSDELQAMIAAGRHPAERDLKLGDSQPCTDHQDCLFFDQANGVVGVKAGFVHGNEGCPDGCGGAGCWIFLYQDGGSWQYVNAQCAQAPGYVPGAQDHVYVSGCANVREEPYKSARVVACLANGTTVDVDSAPVYSDRSIWWHLAGKGWMAHDFLVAPAGTA